MESTVKNNAGQGWFASFADIRTDTYVLLASLLGQPPTQAHADVLQSLSWDDAIPARLCEALHGLRQAARGLSLSAMEREYNDLFVAMGCGVLAPYASWYRDGTLQSPALASLRSDLMRLGITRQDGCHEPEDHAAAICEAMAILSRNPDGEAYTVQADFHHRHIEPWLGAFFKDLQTTKRGDLFPAIGLLGGRFLESESEYLKYGINKSFLTQ